MQESDDCEIFIQCRNTYSCLTGEAKSIRMIVSHRGKDSIKPKKQLLQVDSILCPLQFTAVQTHPSSSRLDRSVKRWTELEVLNKCHCNYGREKSNKHCVMSCLWTRGVRMLMVVWKSTVDAATVAVDLSLNDLKVLRVQFVSDFQ